MIDFICNSKSMHIQRETHPAEPSTTYQVTFIVRSAMGEHIVDSRFTVIVTKSEFDRLEVGKTYRFGP